MSFRFTVKDYHRMSEADVFDPDDRVELFDGRVAPGAFPELVLEVAAILG